MRRLTVARDRELRHAAGQDIVWRVPVGSKAPYAWCRVCGRDATKQVRWLMDEKYLERVALNSFPQMNLAVTTDAALTYLRRYPR